jgi:hypothetical protein
MLINFFLPKNRDHNIDPWSKVVHHFCGQLPLLIILASVSTTKSMSELAELVSGGAVSGHSFCSTFSYIQVE